MSTKLSIDFKGIEDYFKKLESIGEKHAKSAVENALKASSDYVMPNVKKAMPPHERTGKTESSIIKDNQVSWVGNVASIDIGFRIREGGLASIFLMYGTPHMEPDKKLYNAIYGTYTAKKVKEIQKKEFEKMIERVME